MKSAMMMAMKKKRASVGDDNEMEISAGHDDSDMAPPSAHGAEVHGSQGNDNEAHMNPKARPEEGQNLMHDRVPDKMKMTNHNSKTEFHDPKKPLTEPADHNKGHMLAGNGVKTQNVPQGVNVHENPRAQGGKPTRGNFFHGLAAKAGSAAKAKMGLGVKSKSAGMGEDTEDAAVPAEHDQVQPEFAGQGNGDLDTGSGDEMDAGPGAHAGKGLKGMAKARAAMAARK